MKQVCHIKKFKDLSLKTVSRNAGVPSNAASKIQCSIYMTQNPYLLEGYTYDSIKIYSVLWRRSNKMKHIAQKTQLLNLLLSWTFSQNKMHIVILSTWHLHVDMPIYLQSIQCVLSGASNMSCTTLINMPTGFPFTLHPFSKVSSEKVVW